jgi:hypothetical protein
MNPPVEEDLSDLVDAMVFHARGQEAGKSLELLRRAVPNYSAADLPDPQESRLDYPQGW